MLSDHWPLWALLVRTPRLELRVPAEAELAELADVAAHGIHEPGHQPFLTPWAADSPTRRAREVLQRHWRHHGTWTPADWVLDLAVFEDGRPLGVQTVQAREFGVLREVLTGSWLGLAHHGRGVGTEMRHAVLQLAFAGLNAVEAVSESFAGNAQSIGVSRKLGYRPDGVSGYAVDGEAKRSQRFRLTREDWERSARPEVTVDGLEPCLELFGAVPPAS
ncbi:GNAT family protein [Spongiactinospora sp. TRM90649]|uniref:GNAT family N-acetyltransferase n=1 Tax=Spongiactinospora sp. TRM90649 TaxID=3031114 RepID=UPI0023F9F6C1|nr:GNAT family protein [Spongiactinospora sp. TRM90649]MDF5757803.1 GNAT family protein [Spongiactinospora sp. TRM90649]